MAAGQVETLVDPRRKPGLHRSGRSRLRRGRCPRCRSRFISAQEPDETAAARQVASAGGALPGELGRRPRARRHGVHPAADDRAAVRRQDGRRGGRASFADTRIRRAYDIVRNYWLAKWPAAGAEKTWRKRLHDGIVPGTASPAVKPARTPNASPPRSARFAPAGKRYRSGVLSELLRLGRPLRQQRLAAGSARPDDQADLGQRGAAQSRRRRASSASATAMSIAIAAQRPGGRACR